MPRIVDLLRSHRVRIARALVRQTRTLAPRYQQIDEDAHERHFITLLNAVEHVLVTGDDRHLRELSHHMAQMRGAMGFEMKDYLLSSMSFLPVMRRFLFETATDLETAIDEYEAFEALALPLVAQAASIFIDAEEETAPSVRPPVALADAKERLRAVRIERVTGDESEESSLPLERPPVRAVAKR